MSHCHSPFAGIYRHAAARLAQIVGALSWLMASAHSGAQPLPTFDFSRSLEQRGWFAAHDISGLEGGTNGLAISISGIDPYLVGPGRDYPSDRLLWLRVRLKSSQAGTLQVFYYTNTPTEAASARIHVPAGQWFEGRLALPALGAGYHLRIDPPGSGGVCLLQELSFEERPVLREPEWPKPQRQASGTNIVTSGELSLAHASAGLGSFEVRVKGRSVAIGNACSMLGYMLDSKLRWLSMTNPAAVTQTNGEIRVRCSFHDADGAQWLCEQLFSPGGEPGGIEVQSRVTVSADRHVVFLPMLTLLPGVGSFGTNKTQAMIAGVEFLENELSSSQADATCPGWLRRVPDSLKLTFPLMALSADGDYVGLIWEQQPHWAALHDSPDRLFHSGGHVMGLIFPGSDPGMRDDGHLLPYEGKIVKAGQPLVLQATIIGGRGTTIIPAVQQYVARRGLPPVPATGYSATEYYNLAAHGWLDSQIREGAKFRHAVGENFGASAAADAAMYMDWLSIKVPDAKLADRLKETAAQARALVPPASYNSAAVGHVRFPVEALVYGSVPENLTTALNEGLAQARGFQPNGIIEYHPPTGAEDLGRTHWSREANGLTALPVAMVLERGVFSGDRALISQGLNLLRTLEKFKGTVPRGAQTWEVPLHTPDILASAWLVRAYTLGYELTGETDFLDQARYWAWAGVPFIYLIPTGNAPAGVYSTIPVLGATQFVAPLWIGLPVQWCGLVYGDAIRRFSRHDPSGPWLRLADGIAAAGIQHTHTASEPAFQGLLPDSFDLRSQQRNLPPINPGTLMPEALQLFGERALYDFCSLRRQHLLVHAPGPISVIHETDNAVSLKIDGWPKSPFHVLVNGFTVRPVIRINGVDTAIEAPHVFQDVQGRLILQLVGPAIIEIHTTNKATQKL